MTIQHDTVGRPRVTDGQPIINGYNAATAHPKEATTTIASPAAGVLLVFRTVMWATAPINGINAIVATAGATLTSGQCFAGVYDAAGTLLGTTADQSANWISTGSKANALTAATAPQRAGSPVYAAFLWNGTTAPQWRGPSGNGFPNQGVSGALLRMATILTGQTSLPGSITPASLTAFGGAIPFVGLN